jgi:hypothetical protein
MSDEIEVTQKMIEAGIAAHARLNAKYETFDALDPEEAAAIYRDMHKARPCEKPQEDNGTCKMYRWLRVGRTILQQSSLDGKTWRDEEIGRGSTPSGQR